jgi:hypothetical protein
MFDARLRPLINPALDRIGAALARRGVSANQVSAAGAACAPPTSAPETAKDPEKAPAIEAAKEPAPAFPGPALGGKDFAGLAAKLEETAELARVSDRFCVSP